MEVLRTPPRFTSTGLGVDSTMSIASIVYESPPAHRHRPQHQDPGLSFGPIGPDPSHILDAPILGRFPLQWRSGPKSIPMQAKTKTVREERNYFQDQKARHASSRICSLPFDLKESTPVIIPHTTSLMFQNPTVKEEELAFRKLTRSIDNSPCLQFPSVGKNEDEDFFLTLPNVGGNQDCSNSKDGADSITGEGGHQRVPLVVRTRLTETGTGTLGQCSGQNSRQSGSRVSSLHSSFASINPRDSHEDPENFNDFDSDGADFSFPEAPRDCYFIPIRPRTRYSDEDYYDVDHGSSSLEELNEAFDDDFSYTNQRDYFQSEDRKGKRNLQMRDSATSESSEGFFMEAPDSLHCIQTIHSENDNPAAIPYLPLSTSTSASFSTSSSAWTQLKSVTPSAAQAFLRPAKKQRTISIDQGAIDSNIMMNLSRKKSFGCSANECGHSIPTSTAMNSNANRHSQTHGFISSCSSASTPTSATASAVHKNKTVSNNVKKIQVPTPVRPKAIRLQGYRRQHGNPFAITETTATVNNEDTKNKELSPKFCRDLEVHGQSSLFIPNDFRSGRRSLGKCTHEKKGHCATTPQMNKFDADLNAIGQSHYQQMVDSIQCYSPRKKSQSCPEKGPGPRSDACLKTG